MIKKICFAILSVLIGVVAVFIILEIFFRVFRGAPTQSASHLEQVTQKGRTTLFEPNTDRHNTAPFEEFEHNTHINSLGYRGRDFEQNPLPGRVRIFAIGDSFTHGVGAEDHETIPARLEQKLMHRRYQTEVINAGVGNTSPIVHYVNLRRIHMTYQPDMVLLFLDMTDLHDDWSAQRHVIINKNGEIDRFDPEIYYGRRDWWITLTNRSAFLRYLHKKLVRTIRKIQILGFATYVRIKIQGKRAKAVIANLEHIESKEDQIEHDRLLFMRGRSKKELIDEQWPLTAAYVLKIRDVLTRNGIPFVLVTYPHGTYVGPKQWDKGREFWGFPKNWVDKDYYAFEVIEKFSKENDIPLVNALDFFLRAPKDKKYFYDHDGHMTPAGYELVAEAIVKNRHFQRIFRRVRKSVRKYRSK